MNLHQLKESFRTLSGRYDLVDDDETLIVDELIWAASRHLDRVTQHQKSPASYFKLAAINDFAITIPVCRAVKEVWLASTTARWQLDKKNIQDLIYDFLSTDDVTSGTPLYYSPVITRKAPATADLSSFASYMTYLDTQPSAGTDYDAIVILPPTEAAVLVEVRGLFYNPKLVNEADENYWSTQHPFTLLKACFRELEIFNQNQNKKRQWDDALKEDIISIGMDLVEEEISEITQISN